MNYKFHLNFCFDPDHYPEISMVVTPEMAKEMVD